MDATTRNLIWRELRERRTQLSVGLLGLIGGAAYCIAMSNGSGGAHENFFILMLLYGLAMPVLLAMRTSLGEMTDRTRSFSDGLPISVRRRGWIRLAGGAAVLVVPMVAGGLLLSAYLAVGRLELPAGVSRLAVGWMFWYLVVTTACSATSLYLIVCLLGTTLRAEAHLGYCGAAASCLWFLGAFLARVPKTLGHSEIGLWLGAIAPQGIILNIRVGAGSGSLGGAAVHRAVLGPLLVNVVIQLASAAIFVRRYSRLASGGTAEPTAKAARIGWRPRLASSGVALAWLACRQSVPMCLPGLLIACLMTTLAIYSPRTDLRDPQEPLWQLYTDALPAGMGMIGILWAAVVGSGVFSSEVDGRIGEFWRTRPISAGRLFGVKFVGGLLAVLLVLDGSAIAVTWRSPNWGADESMNWTYLACILPLHATMFAVAVAWTCLLRRAVLGAMAAIATLILTQLALSWSATTSGLSPVTRYFQRNSDSVPHGAAVAAAAMGLLLVASILVGWLALRRYDPRRLAS